MKQALDIGMDVDPCWSQRINKWPIFLPRLDPSLDAMPPIQASSEAVRADQHGYTWKFLAKQARASLGMASKYRKNPLLERGAVETDEHALFHTANRRIKELEEKWPLPRASGREHRWPGLILSLLLVSSHNVSHNKPRAAHGGGRAEKGGGGARGVAKGTLFMLGNEYHTPRKISSLLCV